MEPQSPQHRPSSPPGYGQAQYGAPPQAGYGPPGMPPYPPQYQQYPPQKRGMPGWAWVLIILGVGFAMLMVVGILALAAIPLITSNTSEARRAEGEYLLSALRNRARVAYLRTGNAPLRLTGPSDGVGCDVSRHELTGQYYEVEDRVGAPNDTHGELYASPLQTSTDGRGTMTFHWQTGDATVSWQ